MKLSQLQVVILREATVAALQTSVNAALAGSTASEKERTAIGDPPVRVLYDGTQYVATITFTE